MAISKVLIVDDSKTELHHLSDVLGKRGYAVRTAASGEEVRTHLGPFLEGAFREWASAETAEMARAFEVLTERQLAWLREDEGQVGRRVAEALGLLPGLAPPELGHLRLELGDPLVGRG